MGALEARSNSRAPSNPHMADSNSSGNATAAIVGVVALFAIALFVYFGVMRGGIGEGGGTDIDVNVDPGAAVEAVTE